MNYIDDGIFDCIKQIILWLFPLFPTENEGKINKEIEELIRLLKELIRTGG